MKKVFWAFLTIFLISVQASAATINVTTILDETDGCSVGTGCSLREAITQANLTTAADEVVLQNTNETYLIQRGVIRIESDITIKTANSLMATIDGSQNSTVRLFEIDTIFGVNRWLNHVVTLRNLKFQNFNQNNTHGGVLYFIYSGTNTLNMTNCNFSGNGNSSYSSVYILGANNTRQTDVNIKGLTFFNNGSLLSNQGAMTIKNANLNISQTIFDSNHSPQSFGGALYTFNTSINMEETIFVDNTGLIGGGAYLSSVDGSLNHLLFARNNSVQFGGGLNIASDSLAFPTNLVVYNTAFFDNTANSGSAVSAYNYVHNTPASNIDFITTSLENNHAIVTGNTFSGGAAYFTKANVTFNSSTIAKNTSATTFTSAPLSAGLVMYNQEGTIITKNSIIADNNYIAPDASQTSVNCANFFEPAISNPPALLVTSYGGNILDSDCTPVHEDGEPDMFDADINFGDPIIIPELGYSAGYNLQATSPAIDNALDCTTAPLASQSGSSIAVTNDINLTSRPYGLACDTGAVELTCTLNSFYPDADGDGFGTGTAVQSCKASIPGYAANNTDCNDTNAALLTVASVETCDGLDNNCNGESDEGIDCTVPVVPVDPVDPVTPVDPTTPADPAIPADPETPGAEVTPGDETTSDDPVTVETPTTDTANKSSGSGGCSLAGDSSTTNHVASGLMLSLMILGLMITKRKQSIR